MVGRGGGWLVVVVVVVVVVVGNVGQYFELYKIIRYLDP